jgi:hypothetical protein
MQIATAAGGGYQSSYYFSLLEEFERGLKARIPLTLGMALLCAIEQAGREVLRFKHPDRDHFQNRECFDEFLNNYMGYRKNFAQQVRHLSQWPRASRSS